jgi:hypothetical protein
MPERFEETLSFFLPLEAEDFRLLGTMTALWSLLEASIDAHIALVADHFQRPLAPTFWRLGFTQRLRGWKDLVTNTYGTKSSYRGEALSLADFILGIQDKRDRFTHNPWKAVENSKREKIAVINLGNERRKQVQWRVEPRTIMALNRQIYDAIQQLWVLGPLYEEATRIPLHRSL